MPRPLFLTGMMGCGKSTIGHLLASRRDTQCVDLDTRVERLFGASVPHLIARGENVFRTAEHGALRSLIAEPGFTGRSVVVATGGGVVLAPDNRDMMRSAGTVVYLEVHLDTLVQRLTAEQASRPGSRPLLLVGATLLGEQEGRKALRARLQEIHAARAEAYRDCDVVVSAEGEPSSVAERILLAVASCTPRHVSRSANAESEAI